MESEMRHEARQVPSWLIFDVGQRKMKRFVIDAEKFETLGGFFEHADEVLCVDFTSGRNLDAFHDILSGGFGAFEPGEQFEVIWRGASKSRIDLGYAETERALELRLERCHPSNRFFVEGDLERAKAKVGPTVYDWLVEIIRENPNIVFREE